MPERFIRWLVEVWGPSGYEEVREIVPPPDRDFTRADVAPALRTLRDEERFASARIRFRVDGADGIFLVYAGVEPPPLDAAEEELPSESAGPLSALVVFYEDAVRQDAAELPLLRLAERLSGRPWAGAWRAVARPRSFTLEAGERRVVVAFWSHLRSYRIEASGPEGSAVPWQSHLLGETVAQLDALCAGS